MIRRVLVIASVISLLLCAAMVVLWVAASVRSGPFEFLGTAWEVNTRGGWIEIDNGPEPRRKHAEWVRQVRQVEADFEALQDAANRAGPADEQSIDEASDSLAITSHIVAPATHSRAISIPIAWAIACTALSSMLAANAGVRRAGRMVGQIRGRCQLCGCNLNSVTRACPACPEPTPVSSSASGRMPRTRSACVLLLRAAAALLWAASIAIAVLWADSYVNSIRLQTKGPSGYLALFTHTGRLFYYTDGENRDPRTSLDLDARRLGPDEHSVMADEFLRWEILGFSYQVEHSVEADHRVKTRFGSLPALAFRGRGVFPRRSSATSLAGGAASFPARSLPILRV